MTGKYVPNEFSWKLVTHIKAVHTCGQRNFVIESDDEVLFQCFSHFLHVSVFAKQRQWNDLKEYLVEVFLKLMERNWLNFL